jgi:hypothetical protein
VGFGRQDGLDFAAGDQLFSNVYAICANTAPWRPARARARQGPISTCDRRPGPHTLGVGRRVTEEMREPGARVGESLPVPALALVLATACVATAALLAGGFLFVDGAPDLDAGIGRMILFPPVAALVLFALAAVTGAVVFQWRGRSQALLAGIVGIIAGGVLAAMALALLAPGSGGPFVIGLAVVGCAPYVLGLMFGGAVTSGRSVPPASHGEGPRWPAP